MCVARIAAGTVTYYKAGRHSLLNEDNRPYQYRLAFPLLWLRWFLLQTETNEVLNSGFYLGVFDLGYRLFIGIVITPALLKICSHFLDIVSLY